MRSVGFIGGGNMGLALGQALARRFPEIELFVCDLRPERVVRFRESLPASQAAEGPGPLAARAEVVFLAVKPQDLPAVLEGIRATDRLVVSIAAGVPLARLEQALPSARVVRVMPNTPCLVGAMAAGYACGARASAEDRQTVAALLGAAGYAVELDEELLDAVTGLSGSGPAFVARLVEAFLAAGEALGLPKEAARKLSLQTFEGTARLLAETGMSPQELVDMVSSPKGTTVAGRRVLEASECRQAIIETIAAAARRSKELGR
ncbi:MAG: pyrroline-5-carboxylate reductase [Spirochaetales bacterium]|nr:pyrroline-5-carboxylate reductase [Spirochaetales bacterium]